jgi:hypothetical protein
MELFKDKPFEATALMLVLGILFLLSPAHGIALTRLVIYRRHNMTLENYCVLAIMLPIVAACVGAALRTADQMLMEVQEDLRPVQRRNEHSDILLNLMGAPAQTQDHVRKEGSLERWI